MAIQSRTEAHKLFAALYRKERSPEHQALVDGAIQRTNDIFIRIDLIKKVDEDFIKTSVSERTEEKNEKITKSLPRSSEQMSARKTTSGDSGIITGLLSNIFGVNNEINQFAKETGTIEISLFGRNLKIAKAVENVFKALKEEQILSTIQALRFCEQQGWREWNPLVYNIVNNFNKFFNAFISLDSLFTDNFSPDIFLNRSLKMQMYYYRYLSRPDAKDIVLKYVPEIINKDEKLLSKKNAILTGLTYSLSLENYTPKLTDVIRSFYILSGKKMVLWEDIVKKLNVPPISENQYNASAEIKKEVESMITKVAEEIKVRIFQKIEIEDLKQRYFIIDPRGKIDFDFINPIIEDYFQKHFPEVQQTPALKSSYKSLPHKLLYLLLRDFQANYMPLIEGYVKIGSKNNTKDVLVTQTGLFVREIEELNTIFRNLDAFNRKYPSFQYNFSAFNEDFANGTKDQIISNLLQLLAESADFFGKFASKINVLVANHLLAEKYEKTGEINDKTLLTKTKIIDEVKSMQRFIPFADETLISLNRTNSKTIYSIFNEMAKILINYAVIFKDKATMAKLTLNKKLDGELEKYYIEYKRLTGSAFNEKEQVLS